MAWEWVAPVTTGVVGVVGMASTFWTAKQARASAERTQARALAADREQRQLDQKQRAYANFMEAITETQTRIFDIYLHYSKEATQEAFELCRELTDVVWAAYHEVDFVASPPVRISAGRTRIAVHDSLRLARDTGQLESTITYRLATAAEMKRDLGRRLDAGDEFAISEVEKWRAADEARTEEGS